MKKGNALVTGSSRGIGRAIAIKLAADGYDVVVNYKERSDRAEEVVSLIKGMGRNAVAVKADVSDRAEVDAMFDIAKKELGDIDLLVTMPVDGMKFYELAETLREKLKKKVDLLDIAQLNNNPTLVQEILKDGIKIYG